MTKTLDFTIKNYFNVVLDDGADTKLRVKTPTKALAQQMDAVNGAEFAAMEAEHQYDAVYDLAAAILNLNADGIRIEREDIEDVLGIAEAWLLINTYREFTYEAMQAQAKN